MKRRLIKIILYSFLASLLIPVVIFIGMLIVWNLFGPNFVAPVDNEEWLWSLVGLDLVVTVIAEILLWIIAFYKLIRIFIKK